MAVESVVGSCLAVPKGLEQLPKGLEQRWRIQEVATILYGTAMPSAWISRNIVGGS